MLLGKWEYNNEITHNKEKKSGRETSCSNCLIRLYKLKLVLIHLYRDLGCLIEIESKQFRILPSYGFLNILSSFENGKFPNHLLHIVIISFRFKIIFNWSSIYLNMKLDGYLKSFKYLQYNSWKLNSAIVILKSSWNDYKFQCSRWDNSSRCAIYRLDWNKMTENVLSAHILPGEISHKHEKIRSIFVFSCMPRLSFSVFLSLPCPSSVRFPLRAFFAFFFSPCLSFLLLCFTPDPYKMQNWIYIFFKMTLAWKCNEFSHQYRWGWMRQRKQ